MALYQKAAETLKDKGHLYPCYETEQELAIKRKRLMAAGKPPIYDRASRDLSEEARAKIEKEGAKPHWRFLLSGKPRVFKDIIGGEMRVDLASQSDPVLIRQDGAFLYHLPSVVDDMALGITHVIRGEDHLTNTALHCELAEALGGVPPRFAHHSLIMDASGQRFSKRMKSASVRFLREEGIEAEALRMFLLDMGMSSRFSEKDFNLEHVARAPLRFEMKALLPLNASCLRAMPPEEAKRRLLALGIRFESEAQAQSFWNAIRGNITLMKEAGFWWEVVVGRVKPDIDDPLFIQKAAALLPAPPWSESVWKDWIQALQKATGRKGKDLFLPLRLALTGQGEGPDMKSLLPLIGFEKVRARLKG